MKPTRKLGQATAEIGSAAPLPLGGVDPLVAARTVFNEDRTYRFTFFRHWGDVDHYVVSWGNPGHASGRGAAVEKILLDVCDPEKVGCFGRNKNGSPPIHPLYQRMEAPLVRYFERYT